MSWTLFCNFVVVVQRCACRILIEFRLWTSVYYMCRQCHVTEREGSVISRETKVSPHRYVSGVNCCLLICQQSMTHFDNTAAEYRNHVGSNVRLKHMKIDIISILLVTNYNAMGSTSLNGHRMDYDLSIWGDAFFNIFQCFTFIGPFLWDLWNERRLVIIDIAMACVTCDISV